jgi:hypothetical protein
MVAAEYAALDPSINIANYVEMEKDDYRYIYPVLKESCHVNHGDVC